ncbi:MAG: prolipoprotein diacylglyceryltransferase [Bacteroidia bacterium]|jgi:prolipoprotein diacylglyceryltransferase
MWAYNYPNKVLNVDMVQYFTEKGHTSIIGKVYPVQIYKIVMSVIIFGILQAMRKRWRTLGIMISAYFILGWFERILIEQIPINNECNIMGRITQSEIISSVMAVLGALGFYYLPKGLEC